MRKAFCENCGSKIEDGAHFCSVCGFRFENADEDIIENFADISSQTDISPAEEVSADVIPVKLSESSPEEKVVYKKASYKFEKILLAISAICAVCSLAFYFIVTNFSGIPMKNKAPAASDIPELTVNMAEEILNNATDFPYQYFEKRNMINKNDYIIHPDFIEYASDGDYRCYAVDGIETKDDFFSYFEKYGTREFIEKSLDQSYFYVEKNSKIYFSDNFGMGWYPYSAASMFVEKIDDETYFVMSEGGIVEGVILKYINGEFKATTIDPVEAAAPYNDKDATISLSAIELKYQHTFESVEKDLNKLGLKLDRENVVYIESYWGVESGESYVAGFQKQYKKYKPGDYVGVIVAVDEPDFYAKGAKDGEAVPELTPNEAVEILNKTGISLYAYLSEKDMLNMNDRIKTEHPYYEFTCDAVAVNGIETETDYKAFISEVAIRTRAFGLHYSEYVIKNGKFYIIVPDGIDDFMFSERTLVLEKIDDSTYFALDTWYYIKNIIIYVDGKFKVSDITPEKARDLCNVTSSGVNIPDLENMSLSEAERELNKAGLKLDRSNITKIPGNSVDQFVISAKNSCKKVARGSSVGVYLAVNFADYEENISSNESAEKSSEISDDEARKLLVEASSFYYKWLSPLGYHFVDSSADYVEGDFRCLNENDYIFSTDGSGYEYKLYAIIDDDIKSTSDLISACGKYFDSDFIDKHSLEYVDKNGKMYVSVDDGVGDWEPCSEYTDEIEKISESHYLYYIGNYSEELGEDVAIYYDLIFENGKWIFTERYNDDHPVSPCGGFMPVYNAVERIKD